MHCGKCSNDLLVAERTSKLKTSERDIATWHAVRKYGAFVLSYQKSAN